MKKAQWFVFSIISFVIFLGCFGLYWMWSPGSILAWSGIEVVYASLDLSSNIAVLFGFIFFFLSIGFLFCGLMEGRKK